MQNMTGNEINEAVQKTAKDAMLQKIRSIGIVYNTADGNVHSFTHIMDGENLFALIGMIDDLKNEAYKHFETRDDED